MDYANERLLDHVRQKIDECRKILDGMRFPGTTLTEKERKMLDECYSHICKANDAI